MTKGLLGITKVVALFFLTITFAMSLGWLGDTLYLLLDPSRENAVLWRQVLPMAAGFFAAVVISSALLYRFGRDFLPVRNLAPVRSRKKRALLLNVSRLKQLPERSDEGWLIPGRKEGEMVVLRHGPELASTLNSAGYWPWAQTLRAIHFHHDTVKYISLIGSSGEDGSQPQLTTLQKLISDLFGSEIDIHCHADGICYRDIDSLYHAYLDEVNKLQKHDSSLQHGDIAIDITAGQKLTSIAGAMATLHMPNLSFQYIEADESLDTGYRPLSFDCVTSSQNEGI